MRNRLLLAPILLTSTLAAAQPVTDPAAMDPPAGPRAEDVMRPPPGPASLPPLIGRAPPGAWPARHPVVEPPPERWLVVGAVADPHRPGRLGARVSLDLAHRGHLSFGLAAETLPDGEPDRAVPGGARGIRVGQGCDHRAIAFVAWSGKIAGATIRAQIGTGAGMDTCETLSRQTGAGLSASAGSLHRSGIGPRGEAAVLVALPLGHHLGVLAGPVVSSSAERGLTASNRLPVVDVTWFAGLGYRF